MLDVKERCNCFTLELYEESDTLQFKNIIDIVKSINFYSCKWYYIKHDKDYKKDGVIVKPHYHLLVKLENAICIDNIIKSLVNERGTYDAIKNDFSIVKSFKGCVRYLIHYDEKDKYHYDLSDIVCNDKNVSNYFNDNTIVDNFQLITNIIKDNDIKSMRQLVYYCVNNNLLLAMQYIQDNAYLVSCLFR